MGKRGFPEDDELFVLVKLAHEALHDLFIATHYRSCKNVGRKDNSERLAWRATTFISRGL
jgi:hypothetical protein